MNFAKVKLYTIGCPNCNTLERKLKQTNLEVEIITDKDDMRAKGIKSAPVLELEDGTRKDFVAAIKWLRSNYGI